MSTINNSIFKQYVGTLDNFKKYYSNLDDLQKAALSKALVFIHDKPVDNTWNNDGYIFANGKYYACRESVGLTVGTLSNLIVSGDTGTAGVLVTESNGKLVFTPCLKNELKALTSVGFVESGKTWSAGTGIETILNDIFSKEVWYQAAFDTTENLTVTISKPTLTVTIDDITAVNSSTYEIGAPISVTGRVNASYTNNPGDTGFKFTKTCKTPGNNGFVTNSDTKTKLTELDIPANLSSSGSDALSITDKTGGFLNISVENNAINNNNIKVAPGKNSLEIMSTSKTWKLTAESNAKDENENPIYSNITLTTLSNKGNYSKNEKEGDVDIKDIITMPIEYTESVTNTSKITFTGKYKFYYLWGVSKLPDIPKTGFSGDLTYEEDNKTKFWVNTDGSQKVYTGSPGNAWVLNGYIYVLKPTSAGAPTICNEIGNSAPLQKLEEMDENGKNKYEYTNKYGTSYSLYMFYSNGSKYYDLSL